MKLRYKILSGCLTFVSIIIVILIVIGFAISSKIKENAMLDESWDDSYGTILKDKKYGNAELNTYDLYFPCNLQKNTPNMLMLFVHGGSWMGGDKKDQEYACRRYAKEGYITATMNYSLLNKQHPEVTLQTMTDEIDKCIKDIYKTCKEHSTPLASMMISGQSAGGNLAMLYAYKYKPQIPIKFIAIQVGPTDLNYLFKGAKDANQDSLRMFSPVNYVTPSAPPAILAYGGKDRLISLEHPRRLIAKYDSLGIKYRYIEFPNSNHLLESDKDSAQMYFETIKRWARKK